MLAGRIFRVVGLHYRGVTNPKANFGRLLGSKVQMGECDAAV